MWDRELLDAAREVDAMLPGTPPVAPDTSEVWMMPGVPYVFGVSEDRLCRIADEMWLQLHCRGRL